MKPKKTSSHAPPTPAPAGAPAMSARHSGGHHKAPLGASASNASHGNRGAGKPSLDPRSLLLPYQLKWVDDASRFKIGLQARQTGKDFSSGCEGVLDCLKHEVEGNKIDWLIAAPSERQSMESMEKWKQWVEAYDLAIHDIVEEREGGSETLLKSATIIFPKGSRVIAVPGKPDTVRGYSCNALLTEFAFFEQPDLTWRAILPSITNPLRGGAKKIRLISTPNGIGNKFHDLWSKNYNVPGAKWACHKVTIHDAVAQGLPIDVEELRAALDDPEGWAQEYECEFMDTQSVLLPYDLIASCEHPEATMVIAPDYWTSSRNAEPVDLGIDFGRKKDLTVCWALADTGNFSMTREVLTLEKMPTPDQAEILSPRIARARRVCLDYTGPGIGLGDILVKRFGEWNPDKHLYGKVELCNFTNALKLEIFPKLRMKFEQRRLGVPISRVIREDLHSVNRIVTSSANITYKAPHTADGHADRCTGLALAVRAQSFPGGMGRIVSFSATKRGRAIASRRERTVAG